MNQPGANTISYDGILEGPLPDRVDAENFAEDLKKKAEFLGLPFQIIIEDCRFTVLPGSKSSPAGSIDIWQTNTKTFLEELLAQYSLTARTQLFSTLRSTYYQENQKIQTLYIITPAGVDLREKCSPWIMPAQTKKNRSFILALAGCGLVLVLAAALLAYNKPSYFRNIFYQHAGFDEKQITLETSQIDRYLLIRNDGVDRSGKNLLCMVKKTPAFPASVHDLEAEENRLRTENNLNGLKILHHLIMDEKIWVTFMNATKDEIYSGYLDIRGIVDKGELHISIPTGNHPGTVSIGLE